MYNKVIFYNHFNNGDIHLSRGFLKYIIKKLKDTNQASDFIYMHKNHPAILTDIDDLKYEKIDTNLITSNLSNHEIKNNIALVNTWYGSNNYEYMNHYGISFDSLYLNFKNACQTLFGFDLSLDDYEEYFPTINFDKFELEDTKKFIDKAMVSSNKIILVANGQSRSGQAINFNLSSVALELSKKYKGLIFVLTDKHKEPLVSNDNIFYSSDIINKQTIPDLNENAFLGTHSDFIIGRSSGVFTFCMTKEIMMKIKNTFISFSNLDFDNNKFWLNNLFKNKIKYTSQTHNFNITNSSHAYKVLDQFIEAKYGK